MKTIDPSQWESLKPELDMIGSKPSRRPESDLDQLALKLGGYHGPRWLKDRRKQPLRSRRSAQRLITHLRREAVIRLRLQNQSFRQIGRELGISQVAAWKLWRQVVTDLGERAVARRIGWQILRQRVETPSEY
jgi:DNA-binding CsgD family transcriptional regulator